MVAVIEKTSEKTVRRSETLRCADTIETVDHQHDSLFVYCTVSAQYFAVETLTALIYSRNLERIHLPRCDLKRNGVLFHRRSVVESAVANARVHDV